MNRLFDVVAASQPLGKSRRRAWWGAGVAALAAALAVGAYGPGAARAQATPQINVLTQGSNSDPKVDLRLKGPSTVLQTQLIFPSGSEIGWHMHPGPVVVVVNTGTLTEIHSDGCTTEHLAGSAFYEEAGVVHNAVNRSGGVTELYATFLLPSGTPPLIPEPDPGLVCGQKGKD